VNSDEDELPLTAGDLAIVLFVIGFAAWVLVLAPWL
jgi:hypothetical protein